MRGPARGIAALRIASATAALLRNIEYHRVFAMVARVLCSGPSRSGSTSMPAAVARIDVGCSSGYHALSRLSGYLTEGSLAGFFGVRF